MINHQENYEIFKNHFRYLQSNNLFKIENHKNQPYVRFKIKEKDFVIIKKNNTELQLFIDKQPKLRVEINSLQYSDQKWLEEKFIIAVTNIVDSSVIDSKRLLSLLKQYYGYNSFRDNQEEIIKSIMSGKDTIVLKPTGAGKSLCFQLPALAMDGCAVVISPLISLMQNQVMALKQLGIKAEFINSSLTKNELNEIKKNIKDTKLLYISPERFNIEDFKSWLKTLKIPFFAIDEAHCISRWGHDFRPDYTQLQSIKKEFKKPVIALTATADLRTRSDIPVQLELDEYNLFISNFDRPNIKILVEEKNDYKSQLLRHLKDFKGESGVVYCLSRKTVDETTTFLKSKGYNAHAYHAGLSQEERSQNQEKFILEENVIVVATIAFGMGIDKPNVRFVIHVNMPQNLESYYQEIGRAGRDGEPATAILLYGMQDFIQRQNMIYQNISDQKIAEMGKLQEMLAFSDTISCKRNYLLKYFGDNPVKCNNCSSCLSETETMDVSLIAKVAIKAIEETEEKFGLGYITLLLKGSTSKEIKEYHKQLSSYKSVSESESVIKKTIRQLIVLGNIKIDLDSGYNNLKIVNKNIESSIFIKKESVTNKETEETGSDVPVNKSLADALKAKRLELSQINRVPPYIIFNDKSLKDLVKRMPKNKKSLKNVFGWGDKKIEQYGDSILEVIINFK